MQTYHYGPLQLCILKLPCMNNVIMIAVRTSEVANISSSEICPSIHPMALQPKSGLGLLHLLPPQGSIISGQLPVATAQKAGSILSHRTLPSFPGLSNRSYSFKLSFKHFLRNSCAFHPLDMSRPHVTRSGSPHSSHNSLLYLILH
jgi:hypothetical protein